MNTEPLSSSGLLFIVLVGTVILLSVVLWIYALVSALRNERLDSTMKLVWALVIIFVNGLGALLYLVAAPNRPSRRELTRERRRTRARR